jgi:hypothetical protein
LRSRRRPKKSLGVSSRRAKIDSLKEKIFCARPLKEKEIFAGFGRRQAASRWVGFLPFRAEIVVQKRFALRSAIATNQDIANLQGKKFARSPRPRFRHRRISFFAPQKAPPAKEVLPLSLPPIRGRQQGTP